MTLVIIFASSLFLAVAFIAFRALELKCGKDTPVLRCVRKLDQKSGKLVSGVKFRFLQIHQSIKYILFVKSKEISRRWTAKMIEKAINEYRLRQSAIMGQRSLITSGSASFYLKKISEHKDSEGKGKIEDETVSLVSES